MSDYPKLFLKSQADRRLKLGHLWIYSNEVDIAKTPLKGLGTGDLVELTTAKGQPLGLAFVNPNALICARVLSRQPELKINQGFFKQRLQRALALREYGFAEPYYRAVYGDSDYLPGLVIDRYGEQLVVQISAAGMDQLLDPMLQACEAVFKPRGIILKNNHANRELEGLEQELQTLGEVPQHLRLIENQTVFEVPAIAGQKTGWFYDHRVNRAQLRPWVVGKKVLDVFSYLGGWGVQAAQAGAQSVTCVDSSAAAIEGLVHNAQLNQCAERVSGVCGKAIDVLKQMVAEKEQFGVVILDPPAFIKKRKDQKSGEAAYRHINELALRLLGKEGLLVSASCSMGLSQEKLREIVRGAARHLDRHAQLIYSGSQGPDHPIHPAIPETEYLKAQFYRVFWDPRQ